MPIATFDAFVQTARQVTMQVRGGGLDAELGHGIGIGRHRPGDGYIWHGCLLLFVSTGAQVGAADLF